MIIHVVEIEISLLGTFLKLGITLLVGTNGLPLGRSVGICGDDTKRKPSKSALEFCENSCANDSVETQRCGYFEMSCAQFKRIRHEISSGYSSSLDVGAKADVIVN